MSIHNTEQKYKPFVNLYIRSDEIPSICPKEKEVYRLVSKIYKGFRKYLFNNGMVRKCDV